ncbi:MAG: hypothetical protein ACJ76D_03590 [Solirubrobacterales bacterium]
MRPGGAKTAALAGLLGTAALLVGCGESRHANEQRPQVSRRVSVTISPKEVIVQPTRIAFGPERTQQIPQNQNHPQPPTHRNGPLNVTFVVANQTARDVTVQVLRQSRELRAAKIFAHSPGSFQAELPTGTYLISAGTPEAQPDHLTVGSYRASSQNDVLLP